MINILARDVFLNALLVFVALVLILLQLINPVAKEADDPPPGTMSIYLAWQDGPIDLDLWVLAPGEKGPVGFSAKTGKILSLLRDDLGTSNDPASIGNFENTYSRALPAGEYVINVHVYSTAVLPITASLDVRVTRPGQSPQKLASTTVKLVTKRAEITAIRFRLDANGILVPGSTHNVYKPLYYSEGRE